MRQKIGTQKNRPREFFHGPRKKLNKLEGIAVSASFATNIEINDRYATKGRILAKAAARMCIKKDEVAILGDGFNDYSML